MPMSTAVSVFRIVSGCVDEAQPHQRMVQQAVVLQDADPRIDADQETRPERQDGKRQQASPRQRMGARAIA